MDCQKAMVTELNEQLAKANELADMLRKTVERLCKENEEDRAQLAAKNEELTTAKSEADRHKEMCDRMSQSLHKQLDTVADLRSLLREAMEELRRLEWAETYFNYGNGVSLRCPVCKTKRTGYPVHRPDCRLSALLAKLEKEGK